jgi:hypothetical protein
MKLSADSSLAFPRAQVFAAYRDRLLEMVEFLPNIRRIEQRSRDDDGPRTEIVNVWHGGGDIPAAARAFLSEDMLSWTDYASWNEDEFCCHWRIETHSFTEAVSCRGKNQFVELDGSTRLEIRGEIRIDATKIRAVPRILSKTVGKAVEDVLVKKITPNLISVSDGLRRYLEQGEK